MARNDRPIDPIDPGSDSTPTPEFSEPLTGLSRRKFLGASGLAAATVAAGTAGLVGLEPLVKGGSTASADFTPFPDTSGPGTGRREQSYQVRVDAAEYNRELPVPTHPTNGDEDRYPTKIGNYTKALPHNDFGEVNLNAYGTLLHALDTGRPADFNNIQLGGGRHLVNPQSGLAFDLEGTDSHQLFVPPNQVTSPPVALPPAPALASAEEAGEAVELYWMALLRDVNFNDYATSGLAAQAIANLNTLTKFKGPKQGGQVTAQTLFRDDLPGATTGPYASQFFLLPTPFGSQYVDNRIRTYVPGVDYLSKYADWLTVQNGGATGLSNTFDTRRYLRNGRDIAAFVHVDVLFQAYFNACLILLTPPDPTDPNYGGIGAPFNPGNPYIGNPTQDGFATFGPPAIKTLMCEVADRALKATWYQKWFVHRRLRPEEYGGLVHLQLTQNRYPNVLHPDILNSPAVAKVFNKYGTYLHPQAFPEGSPTHPSYTAGHATVAGACVTILKAVYDEHFVIPNPVVASADGLSVQPYTGSTPLTVGGELNKLASNVATGRHHSGVHWRSDAYWSLRLGQQVAISILRDQRGTYNENFNGYTFTGFDNETITI
jgi:hypothetical protein